MALVQNPISLGTVANDSTGTPIRTAGGYINTDIGNLISAVNNLLTLLGAGNETAVDLGTFPAGSTIADNASVKTALAALEQAIEATDTLAGSYAAAGSPSLPAANDTIETAISKLHAYVAFLDGLDALRFAGTFDATVGSLPAAGTAIGGGVSRGDVYRVTVAGTVGGQILNVGDQIVALIDSPSTALFAGNWVLIDNTDQVISVFGRSGAVSAQNGDYTASQITNTPAGSIAATTVQAAIDELDTEKLPIGVVDALGDLIVGTGDNTVTRLAVGTTDGRALVVDSTQPTGLRYSGQVSNTALPADIPAGTTSIAGAGVVETCNFAIYPQVSANATLNLPNPTDVTRRRSVALCHTGTEPLNVVPDNGTGFVLQPGEVRTVSWTGSGWVPQDANLSVQASFASVRISAPQSTNITVGDHVKFDVLEASSGSDVAADISTAYTVAAGAASIGRIRLKAGRTYRLTGDIGSFGAGSAGFVSYRWYDATGGSFLGSNGAVESSTEAANDGLGGSAEATFTPVVDSYVELRLTSVSGASALGHATFGGPRAHVEQISGFAPILGTTVDASHAIKTTTTAITGNNVILFDSVSGNVAYNAGTGEWTLKAGKTYRLNSMIRNVAATSAFDFRWETAGGAAIGATGSSVSQNAQSDVYADAIYTPTADTNVRVRAIAGTGTAGNGQTIASITQLGSTAFTSLTRDRTTLGASFSTTTHNTFVDVTGLTAVVVPAGTYRLKIYVKSAIENNGAGSMSTNYKLVNVTAGNTDVTGATLYGASAGYTTGTAVLMRSSHFVEVVVTNTAPTSYKLQMQKVTSNGTPNTAMNFWCDADSYIEYEQQL